MPPSLGFFPNRKQRKKKKLRFLAVLCTGSGFYSQLPGIYLMPSDLCGHHAYKWYTDMHTCKQNTHIYKINKDFNLKRINKLGSGGTRL